MTRGDGGLDTTAGFPRLFERVLQAGDEGLMFEFGQGIDPMVNRRVQSFADAVRAAGIPGVRGVTPGYLSVLVEYDGGQVGGEDLIQVVSALGQAARPARPQQTHVVPVCYGGAYGPDLEDVAAATGLSPQEVVRIHAGVEYRVYCLGFSPGFPLCAPLPSVLRLPRRPVPRTKVPRGSVAIAGMQTGIYPLETAGGWHLIGRTPATIFSWRRPEPPLIQPGDTLSFRPIAEEEYRELAAAEIEGGGAPTDRSAEGAYG